MARSAAPLSFLGTSFTALSGADERAAIGSAVAAAGDDVEASPRGTDAVPPFFGVPRVSLHRGVPPDLVTTSVERGDPSTECSVASSSSETPRRT